MFLVCTFSCSVFWRFSLQTSVVPILSGLCVLFFVFGFRVIHGFVASSVVCDLLEVIVCLESRFSTSKEIVMRMYSKVPVSSGSEESQQGFRCRLGLRAILAGQTLPKNVQVQKAQKAAPEATPNETSHALSRLLPITPVHVE